ncbi:MAG: hypothetical protein HC837_20345, partial [Chloroflexaceae bacterium]|nr:hypothetical protein [Chloroflexaceae bacterium]
FGLSLGLRSMLVLVGLNLLGLLWPLLRRRARPGPAPLLWLVVLLTGTYVTLVGGDHFPGGRFFVPVLPAIAPARHLRAGRRGGGWLTARPSHWLAAAGLCQPGVAAAAGVAGPAIALAR